jgi:hypothetical protein
MDDVLEQTGCWFYSKAGINVRIGARQQRQKAWPAHTHGMLQHSVSGSVTLATRKHRGV